MLLPFLLLPFLGTVVSAQNASTTTSSAPAETASPSSTLPRSTRINSTYEGSIQPWCTDPILCPGRLMQAVQLAGLFPDSKTFPDKPTKFSRNVTIAEFDRISANDSLTLGALTDFLNDYFTAEGEELVPVPIEASFNASAPTFLQKVESPIVEGFVSEVIGYWSSLIRETNDSAVCGDRCVSSVIPLNNTAVVPGGRYREVYYWDSYWIIEGLLHSGLADYARDILLNFSDQISRFGFIPNGGRQYYTQRSQPPLFGKMLHLYCTFTNDTSILSRALPLAEQEAQWWSAKRTFPVKSPYSNRTYEVWRYDASAYTAPRPEGYVEDYETVHLSKRPLNATAVYQEIASGAESGWDFSGRWMKEPLRNVSDPLEGLRSLNIRAIAPVDLNAILTANHFTLADLYDLAPNATSNSTAMASLHRAAGTKSKAMLFDLFWDSEKVAFYDFNTTANARSDFFSLAAFYPQWLGLYPDELLKDEKKLWRSFSALNFMLGTYEGAVPCTLLESTLNWDFPNAWPPLQSILIGALANVPRNLSQTPYATLSPSNSSLFSLVPANQLGMPQSALPVQQGRSSSSVSLLGSATVGTVDVKEGWRDVLLEEVANRYIASAFCSWYSTGGAIPGVLEQLPAEQLDARDARNSTGNMFEKFNATALDESGGGGEYEVVVGFGWTNGVVIATAAEYASILRTPMCPEIQVASTGTNGTSAVQAAGGMRWSGTRIGQKWNK